MSQLRPFNDIMSERAKVWHGSLGLRHLYVHDDHLLHIDPPTVL